MDTLFKLLMIFSAILISLFIAAYFFLEVAFPDPVPVYSKSDLMNNYEQKKTEIEEAKQYFESIVQNNKSIYVEFDKDNIAILRFGESESYYDLPMESDSARKLIKQLGWSKVELTTLKQKLNAANCISIEDKNPVTIGYQRSGLGMYLYKIHNEQLSEMDLASYHNSCAYSYYKDNVMLEYRGGAIGPQCFPME